MTSIVVVVLLFVSLLILKKVIYSINHLDGKRIKGVFGGYTAILFIALIVFYMLPSENFIYKEKDSQKNIDNENQVVQDFYDALQKGKVDKVKGVYKNGQWNFNLSENKLTIATSGGEPFALSIYVQRKDTNDNKIEAVHYSTATLLEGVNISDKIIAPEVELKGNQLNVMMPKQQDIQFVKFIEEFTVRQFSKGKKVEDIDYNTTRMILGTRVLYLRIPKDVQLTFDSNKVNVQYFDNK